MYILNSLAFVMRTNKNKKKKPQAASGDSLNQKRRSLLRLFLLDALILYLGYQFKP